jgi:hypothetical protein
VKNNLPTVAVRALAIQEREHDLIAGTFGRAIWITDIGPIEQLSASLLDKSADLFAVKPGALFKTRYTYGATIEELNGDMFFRAENPPFGTTITYYLRNKAGAEVSLVIKDEKDRIVRTLKGSGAAVVHHVQWDLKGPDKTTEEAATKAGITTLSEREALDWVRPGDYTVFLETDSGTIKTGITVRKETQGVKRVDVRK